MGVLISFWRLRRNNFQQKNVNPSFSVFGVTDAVRVDGEDSLTLGQAGRVVDFADALLAAAFPEV